ncbi:MAG: hypothetical protein A3I72_11240 [Candidatus Tectomicrobia bacterium RIFCSPLOWO2_02_FULL_70_19]|nr:MAG: hypothetical protein A3I72_11240 [Candidatus Tectomicrobia bacterium RIFCSPLOWO2_02_FULL_70_19]
MRTAFKEWALVCWALASGRQTLVLRKGGIREERGGFTPGHGAFLLYPTFFHQKPESVVPEAREALARIAAEPPRPDELVITHWAELAEAVRVASPGALLALRGQHIWSEEAARERFERWGENAVHALILRVHALPGPARLPVRAAYAGCRSWVALQDEVETAGSAPVLDEGTFAARAGAIRAALGEG